MTEYLLTVSETAEMLGLSPSRIRHMIGEGKLTSVGKSKRRIPDRMVLDLLRERVRKSKRRKRSLTQPEAPSGG